MEQPFARVGHRKLEDVGAEDAIRAGRYAAQQCIRIQARHRALIEVYQSLAPANGFHAQIAELIQQLAGGVGVVDLQLRLLLGHPGLREQLVPVAELVVGAGQAAARGDEPHGGDHKGQQGHRKDRQGETS
mgnify:CR=1 FL=1